MCISNKLINLLIVKKLNISTIESCTGGYIINEITNQKDSSKITNGGIVAYSNNQKINIGIDKSIIDKYGVYSYECSTEMAKVCKNIFSSEIGIGVTGFFSEINNDNNVIKNGKVHVCIYYNNNEFYDLINIPDIIKTKSDQKKYICEKTLNYVYDILIKCWKDLLTILKLFQMVYINKINSRSSRLFIIISFILYF